MPRSESKDDGESKGGESKGGEAKEGGGGGRELDAVASRDDFDGSSCHIDDVTAIRLDEKCIVERSDGTWRYAMLDGKEGASLEFRVGEGEDDYKLFAPEEFHKIRRLDCGGGNGGK